MHINCGKGILIVFLFYSFLPHVVIVVAFVIFLFTISFELYVCICCFFALFFFLLIFVLFLILFWLFSQRSYPSMLRPLCYLMNMVLVTVLRHDSMKQRAKCPNWCLWKRVILFLLACVYAVCFFFFSLYTRAQVSFVFGVLLFAYDRFKMHFSTKSVVRSAIFKT